MQSPQNITKMQHTQNMPEADAVDASLDLRICPKRRTNVSSRTVEGETVVLDRSNEQIHQLNQTASYIWERCDGVRTLQAIAQQLAESFAIDGETAARDVTTVVAQFHTLHLLEANG
jgi:hypothetical protein